MRARLSKERISRTLLMAQTIRAGSTVSVHQCTVVLGLMASAVLVVPLGRMHMRPFQRWFLSYRMDPVVHRNHRILLTKRASQALTQWTDPLWFSTGVPLGPMLSRQLIRTDASLTGWGAVCEGFPASGLWPEDEARHINLLELEAIRLALLAFQHRILGCHVLIRSDSTAAIAYLNRQGGVRSRLLNQLAATIHLLAYPRLLSISAAHVPGRLNCGADFCHGPDSVRRSGSPPAGRAADLGQVWPPPRRSLKRESSRGARLLPPVVLYSRGRASARPRRVSYRGLGRAFTPFLPSP